MRILQVCSSEAVSEDERLIAFMTGSKSMTVVDECHKIAIIVKNQYDHCRTVNIPYDYRACFG